MHHHTCNLVQDFVVGPAEPRLRSISANLALMFPDRP